MSDTPAEALDADAESKLAAAEQERDEWMRAEHYANERQERAELSFAAADAVIERLRRHHKASRLLCPTCDAAFAAYDRALSTTPEGET